MLGSRDHYDKLMVWQVVWVGKCVMHVSKKWTHLKLQRGSSREQHLVLDLHPPDSQPYQPLVTTLGPPMPERPTSAPKISSGQRSNIYILQYSGRQKPRYSSRSDQCVHSLVPTACVSETQRLHRALESNQIIFRQTTGFN
jgi:hypothetical protein